MGFFDSFFKDPKRVPRPAVDGGSPEDEEAALEREFAEYFGAACEDGVDADELPNGVGEFGYVADNPIPCHLVEGAYDYLRRLRTADGMPVRYERIGSFFSDCSPLPVDGYVIYAADGREFATIYISAYQKRNSGKAPKGFLLAAPPH